MTTNTAPTAPTVTETIRANTATEFRADYAFGVVDSKGRALGCAVSIDFCEARDASEWRNATPARFEFRPYSLRGGQTFGAIPVRAWKNFDTLAAAKAHAAKYVASAAKRAAKVAAADAAKPAAAAAPAAAPVVAPVVVVEPAFDALASVVDDAPVSTRRSSIDEYDDAVVRVAAMTDDEVRSLAAFFPHIEDDSIEAVESKIVRAQIADGKRPAFEREHGFAAGNFDGAYNFDPSDGPVAVRYVGAWIADRSDAYALGYIAGVFSSFETSEVPGACALVVRSLRACNDANTARALASFRRVVADGEKRRGYADGFSSQSAANRDGVS